MKLAILLLCHKNAEQINLFLETLKHPDIEFFIHMDKKADIVNQLIKRQDIHVLPDNLRVDVKWSGFSMIEATLNLLKEAYKATRFDYYWLCSGQDFPLKSPGQIIEYFSMHVGRNFISLRPSYNYQNDHHENHLDKRNVMKYPEFLMDRTFTKRLLKRLYIEISGGGILLIIFFVEKINFPLFLFILDHSGLPSQILLLGGYYLICRITLGMKKVINQV